MGVALLRELLPGRVQDFGLGPFLLLLPLPASSLTGPSSGWGGAYLEAPAPHSGEGKLNSRLFPLRDWGIGSCALGARVMANVLALFSWLLGPFTLLSVA